MKSSSREIHLLYYIYTQMSSDIKKKKVVHQISTTNFKTFFKKILLQFTEPTISPIVARMIVNL